MVIRVPESEIKTIDCVINVASSDGAELRELDHGAATNCFWYKMGFNAVCPSVGERLRGWGFSSTSKELRNHKEQLGTQSSLRFQRACTPLSF